jgi:RNA polymerase sigma factor (TIGR02999 family)
MGASAGPMLEAEAITAVLRELTRDRPRALADLIALTQRDLRRIAHSERLGVGAGDTLSTTALVNEAFLRLRQGALPEFVDRKHFYATAARAMRQILVDHARAHLAQKRGSGAAHVGLDDAQAIADESHAADEMLNLDRALDDLDAVLPRAAQVVYLRFFVGLADAEIGALLDIDESTVRRDWLKARGWLYQRVGVAE